MVIVSSFMINGVLAYRSDSPIHLIRCKCCTMTWMASSRTIEALQRNPYFYWATPGALCSPVRISINLLPLDIRGVILGEPGGLKWEDVEDYISRSQDFRLLGEGINDAVYTEQILTGKQNDHAIIGLQI